MLGLKNNMDPKLEAALKAQYDPQFWEGMKARMEMSYFKYGELKDAYPHKVDAIESLKLRLDKYMATGNTEFLMDVANFAMIEFMLPRHPKAHFQATDSDQSPGRKSIHGRVSSDPNIHKHEYKHEGD